MAQDERYVALATGPRAFTVLEQSHLTRRVAIGDRVKAYISKAGTAITLQSHDRDRSR